MKTLQWYDTDKKAKYIPDASAPDPACIIAPIAPFLENEFQIIQTADGAYTVLSPFSSDITGKLKKYYDELNEAIRGCQIEFDAWTGILLNLVAALPK